MISRFLTFGLIGAALLAAGVLFSKNNTIDKLNESAAETARQLKNKNNKIVALELVIESERVAVQELKNDAENRERIISAHYERVQDNFSESVLIESKVTKVLTDDKSSTDWGNTNLPDHIKRVFDNATRTPSGDGDKGGQGVTTCSSTQCLRTTEDGSQN